LSDLFGFESDFVDSLRCIPMAVRLRLDVTGVKLKLNEWSKLDQSQRHALVSLPFSSPPEIRAYRDTLFGMVAKACGSPPSMLAEMPDPIWNSQDVPDQVQAQAQAYGLLIPAEAWSSLTLLQRFALVKLSRPGHENRNFMPALEEFGILPP
jgi:hypothetical protein